ncbi:MAG: hypothetical protein ACM37W_00245 [Actinomycetota bacterium]
MSIEIDPYPVSELPSRYNIGRAAAYNRLESLGIKPTKQGNKAFITLDDLQALDRLHSHLQKGGMMGDFQEGQSPSTTSALSPLDTVDVSSRQDIMQDFLVMVEAIGKLVTPADPLTRWKSLEEASEKGWLLSSAEVRQLTGVKPKGETFQRGSFTFIRSGKIGGQLAWRVEKVC